VKPEGKDNLLSLDSEVEEEEEEEEEVEREGEEEEEEEMELTELLDERLEETLVDDAEAVDDDDESVMTVSSDLVVVVDLGALLEEDELSTSIADIL
jgi:hypothetical protein